MCITNRLFAINKTVEGMKLELLFVLHYIIIFLLNLCKASDVLPLSNPMVTIKSQVSTVYEL